MPANLQEALLAWYEACRRDLPWRRQRDPYRIWVSEVMLQQTRVEAAIPYYERWLERFPTLVALAAAPEEEVLAAWAGLGYYARARHLHAAAREVAARYGGLVPTDPAAFSALPGVGEYTAGAVMSIAYGQAVPAVDGNVLRVLVRLYNLSEDASGPAARRRAAALARALLPPGRAGEFNQALMELGALVCVPGRPRCGQCPVAQWCQARAAGREAELPVRAARRPPQPVAVAVALVQDPAGRLLLVRRPRGGLLGGLWGFPAAVVPPGMEPAAVLADHLAACCTPAGQSGGAGPGEPVASAEHAFSHRRWLMTAYAFRLEAPVDTSGADGQRWAGPRELFGFPLPAAFRKIAVAAGVLTAPNAAATGGDKP